MSGSPVPIGEVGEVGRWADRTRAVARVLLVVLAVAVLAAVLGQEWAAWVRFGAAGVAAIGAFRSAMRLVGASVNDFQAARREARRRVVRVVRRGGRPAVGDEPLAVAYACTVLRTCSGVWTGLLIAGSQVAGFFTRTGVDVFRVGILLLAVLLALAFYWNSGRVRAQVGR